MKTDYFAEQWKSMQKIFLPTSAIPAMLRENADRFWENQEKVLDNMQALANGWFERRRTGTRSARETAERMCGTETIVDLARAYQDWALGAFERIMAVGSSWQQHIMAGAFASPPLAPLTGEKEKEEEPARSEAKAPARPKTTA